MNHIITKAPKAEPTPVKILSSEQAFIEVPPTTEDTDTSQSEHPFQPTLVTNHRVGNTVLRVGAFLTAAICTLAMVRAVSHPSETVTGFLKPLTRTAAVTTSALSEVSSTDWQTEYVSGESPVETEALPSVSVTTTFQTNTATAADTTQSSQTTAIENDTTAEQTPVSKNRTVEELAEAFAGIPLSNEAGLTYDADQLSTLVPTFTRTEDPLVLIIHTHGSESYADTDGRSEDITQNVVAVGAALQEELEKYGISVIHDERMYDIPSYTKSYNEAYNGIQEMLERYPSIQMVMDIHRDGYTYEDGSLLRTADTLTNAAGETIRTARVMFLVGTNAGTLEHPTWRSHLAFAMALQTRMEDIVDGITRSVFLRRQRFNEHLTPGSLLVEVGSSGDTLEEAKTAVRIFGQALAEEILSGEN